MKLGTPVPEDDKKAHEVFERVKSNRAGAKELNIPLSTFKKRVARHRKRMACDADAPDGFKVRGTSTLFNNKGEVVAQWVKTTQDHKRLLQLLREAIEAMKGEVSPVAPVLAPSGYNDDLCALYVLSDYHIGMFAHIEEGGADWNLKISEDHLKKWATTAVQLAPAAHTAVFLQNGDFLHFDGMMPVTPQSRHVLDADSRFQKIVHVAIKGIRFAVQRMLEKHQHVHLILSDGNHDQASSCWLRELFAVLYENEPRVTVDCSEQPYYCFEWGKTSIFSHHGDKRNINNVSQVIAGLFREVFGRTVHSYCHLGHVHHSASKEDSLMHVTVHPTLAARDSYAARYGYVSARKARTFIYHKEYGEVGSISITPEMLK